MSFPQFLDDLAHFNFSHAGSRFLDWLKSDAWPGLKQLVTKASGDEEKILQALIPVAVNDVVSGGFTTDAFVKAGKDVLAQLVAQNISTFNMQYVMALLNAEVAPLAPAVTLPASPQPPVT